MKMSRDGDQRRGLLTKDEARRIAANVAKLPDVCTENLNADIMVMKSAKDWV